MTSTFPRSGVLILGPNSIQSLLPSTLISQAESLLENHSIDGAANLADQQRRKLHGKALVSEDEVNELCYVYQRIGFQCFVETLFEDAGRYLFNGDLDARVLVSYYPELRGSLFAAEDVVEMFAGVAEHLPSDVSVDDIVRNYSPHLAPNTRTAPPTAELRQILGIAAKDMLQAFLRKCRVRRLMDGGKSSLGGKRKWKGKGRAVPEVEDTVLAKLLAQSGNTTELYGLLQEPNNIVLTEIEPVLQQTRRYCALCMIYRQRGEHDKLLDAWSKLVDGEWTDDDVTDPLESMVTLLGDTKDRTLTQKWGVWLTKRDPERGLKLLISRDSSKRKDNPEDELAMLQQIQAANPVAGIQYLEYLVLQRRSMSPELHMQLATACLDQLLESLTTETVSKLWRAKDSSYASGHTEASFLSYLASTTPDSEHKRIRLKTILFLQGSTLYDVGIIRRRLLDGPKILKLELAIVNGKLGDHQSALAMLVHQLRDASSAEAYCALGGEVIPAKVARSVGERCSLQQWTLALFPLPVVATKATPVPPVARQKSVQDGLKTELLKILLQVYMADEEFARNRTAHLLNSQSMILDVVDVIPLVPLDWPLNAMSSFLARSFRRTLHARHEGQIVKSISAGQNLEVSDHTWQRLRNYGAIIEEPVEEEGSACDEKGLFDENSVLSEKIVIHLNSDRSSHVK